MGVIDKLFGLLFGSGRNVVTETAEVFRVNAENEAERGLTLRSAATGFLLGGVLAATAMYIGAKTGISIGVGLTSVILAFAMYRMMARAGFARDFTILENNCTQSIATAAG